jgi:chromatin remodeling complex protein RSC6
LAAKKKATTKSTSKKSKTKAKSQNKSKSGKPAFGGYAINFAGRKETVEQVFGNKPIAPSEMTKKIWAFVKAKSLSNR